MGQQRRPLVNVSGVITEVALTDNVTKGMESNLSDTINTANGVTAITLTTRYTFMTGTAGLSLAITLPAASDSIDGQLMTITSTAGRALTSWSSSGGTVTGLPGSLTANQSVTIKYVHSQTRWFVS